MRGVVVCDPDITYLRNGGQDVEFIVIGSDGIFDKLNNEMIGDIVWGVIKECQANTAISVHQICGRAADEILREAARLKTMDNISVVVMAFKKLSDYLEKIRYSSHSATTDN